MAVGGKIDGIGDQDDDIRYLFSYNLQRLASLSSRIALLDIKQDFGINIHDWRAMAVLDFLEIAPLQTLAKRAGVQKSQMSRTVSALEDRGFIERDINPEDKRSVHLRLTQTGRDLVAKILAASRDRNRQMLQNLSDEERCELMRLMEKITVGSLDYLRALKGESTPNRPPPPATIFETEIL
ncbi:DNA-binding MarR family transcriptional regulator [Pacificibacter maritimus]|uniref:DNA-binding MarR family transcriptional regulator n=1 Tax=Pacificibacter maritimus TaxID=762213 RepID=A0A3N4UTQ5_9RHOB|nr:MarR family transcriptional regulator [Pacificibacter maritimus]RPE70931.1 DNA-binding MarR family transcriptional regulator [Pacificibacter maritimus]